MKFCFVLYVCVCVFGGWGWGWWDSGKDRETPSYATVDMNSLLPVHMVGLYC